MSALDAYINLRVRELVDDRQRSARDEVILRRAIEATVHEVITRCFSSAAIDRAADELGGDRVKAVGVLLASFHELSTQKPASTQSCVDCGEELVATFTGFKGLPDIHICSRCGVRHVRRNKKL